MLVMCSMFCVPAAASASLHVVRKEGPSAAVRITKLISAGIGTQTQACLDDAFRTLEQLQVESHSSILKPETAHKVPGTATPQAGSSTVLDGSKEELQRRLVQSATIMRKLYTRNSALESQLAILQTPKSGCVVAQESTPAKATAGDIGSHQERALSFAGQDSMVRPSTTPARGQIPTPISLLHQKDAVIGQLQAALSSSQRQVGLLRAALERGATQNASGSSKPCAHTANRSAREAERCGSDLRPGSTFPSFKVDRLGCGI